MSADRKLVKQQRLQTAIDNLQSVETMVDREGDLVLAMVVRASKEHAQNALAEVNANEEQR